MKKIVENTLHHDLDNDISLNEIFIPLWTWRWGIIFFTVSITMLSAVYASFLKPSYKATAILQIGSTSTSSALSINEAFSESKASIEQIRTQYELMRSRKFAERVVAQMNLIANRDFYSSKYKNTTSFFNDEDVINPSINIVIDGFRNRLTISPIVKTELVKISFVAYSPELAMKVANQIGESYLHYQDERHNDSKENTSQWLIDQLDELGKKLESSEHALQSYREAEGIVDLQGVVSLISAELTQLKSSSLRAIKNKDDLKITYQYIQKNRADFLKLTELHEVTDKSVYIQLQKTQDQISRKVSELSKRYGPMHPKRIAVKAELDSINMRLTKQVNDIILSIEKDYLSLVTKVSTVEERLAQAKIEFLRLNRLKNKLSQLQREVDTNRELFNNYLMRLKETDAMANYKANFYVRFIDKALMPESPFSPNKKLIIILSFLLSAVLSSTLVIMRELFLDTLNSQRKLDNFNDAPVIAVLPKFKTTDKESKENSFPNDNHFTEAIRSLRTSLLFQNEQKPPKVIAVTSSVPGEGKSTVALNLARSFSEMEKVLLIEADMRHPTVAKNLKLDLYRPGLSNLLAKTHQINECIVRDENLKLDILTSGISPANPLAFLSMKRFSMLIKVFGNFYDRIIIETPPVNAVSDAVIISKLVDSVIYIVHAEKTPKDQISSGLRILRQVGAPVEGIVINNSQSIDSNKYQNKYFDNRTNIVKLPVRKRG